MNERDAEFAAAARDWLNTLAEEEQAEDKMRRAQDDAERLRKRRLHHEAVITKFVGANVRVRAASCGRNTVLVEFVDSTSPVRVRKIPTIKAGVDAP